MKTEVVIIGGGPAGLMAANRLSELNIDYILIDKNPLLGKKLLITGGSRCNVTNIYDVKDFINNLTIKHNRFLYSTLSTFGSKEILQFFNNKGIEFNIEEDIKYFPKSNKSIDILNALKEGITGRVYLNTTVLKIEKNSKFEVTTSQGVFSSKYVVVATGSKSFPSTGSTGDGVKFAQQFGHTILPFYPAETNVHSKYIKDRKNYLQGIVVERSNVRIFNTKTHYNGNLLFTHFGLSGPVIQHLSEDIYKALQVSETFVEVSLTNHDELFLNSVFYDENNKDIFMLKLLNQVTFKRISNFILDELEMKNRKMREFSKKDILKIIETLLRFKIKVDRTESIENAYVNGGGVSTKEINPKSFASKRCDNMYFIGETVDVHGPIGGYNITIALSSGYSAANSIANQYGR